MKLDVLECFSDYYVAKTSTFFFFVWQRKGIFYQTKTSEKSQAYFLARSYKGKIFV